MNLAVIAQSLNVDAALVILQTNIDTANSLISDCTFIFDKENELINNYLTLICV